jgi:DNA-binding GntR family transcriptional regulator
VEAAARAGDLEQVEALNFEIHRTIYRGAQAPKIHWLLAATLVYAPRRFYAAIEGWTDSTIHEHHGVLKALRDRDAEAARREMMSHVHTAGRLLMAHLSATNRTAI